MKNERTLKIVKIDGKQSQPKAKTVHYAGKELSINI